ncbi:hypothetical protein SNEBB_002059 [Seison nebaliae]|nr:hypothetical protein SNEBB_002059 [Seison nebaliae]
MDLLRCCRIGNVVQHREKNIFGEIKFIGQLPKLKGEWIGVDWFNGDGKHSGEHDGIKYFETKFEKSGSFIRRKHLVYGKNVYVALLNVYFSVIQNEEMGMNKSALVVDFNDLNEKRESLNVEKFNKCLAKFCWNLQTVNVSALNLNDFHKFSSEDCESLCEDMEKMNRRELKELMLESNLDMSSRSVLLQLSKLNLNKFENLKTLEVAHNFIRNWDTIFDMILTLTSKKLLLNISGNPLLHETLYETDDDGNMKYLNEIESIHSLILCSININFHELLHVLWRFPKIKLLIAYHNPIRLIESPLFEQVKLNELIIALNHLNSLDLQKTQLNDWNEILKLNMFQNLECLKLSNCNIQSIRMSSSYMKDYPEIFDQLNVEMNEIIFPKLRELFLKSNNITDWHSVNSLRFIKNLRHLHLKNNPITNDESLSTYLITARIGTLENVDGSFVNEKQFQTTAARTYLTTYMGRYLKEILLLSTRGKTLPPLDGTTKKVLAEKFFYDHPRWLELIDQYKLDQQALVEMIKSLRTLDDEVLEFTILLKIPQFQMTLGTKKKFLETMLVLKMKQTMIKYFMNYLKKFQESKLGTERKKLEKDEYLLRMFNVSVPILLNKSEEIISLLTTKNVGLKWKFSRDSTVLLPLDQEHHKLQFYALDSDSVIIIELEE